MKKLLLLLAVTLCLNAKGQIVLEQTYTIGQFCDFGLAYFQSSGYKYFKVNYPAPAPPAITVYNMNHSIYRYILIPPQSASNWWVRYLSEALFDTDSTDFDYMINTNSPYNTTMYNENGSVILAVDSFNIVTAWPGNASILQAPIMNTDSGTKMILRSQPGKVKIFALPGMLPCGNCGNPYMGVPLGGESQIIQPEENLSNPYPNPTISSTRIDFTLPKDAKQAELVFYDTLGKEVKRFKVDGTFGYITVSTADMPAGTYYYNLQTPTDQSAGKKMVVVK